MLSADLGPRTMFADRDQAVLLADMSGDGMPDWVVVSWSSVSYHANLGGGLFGPRVSMAGAPIFESEKQFDPHNLRPADVDGSGRMDLFYLGSRGVVLYRNLAGNAWTDAEWFAECPPTSPQTNVSIVDLLGNGTACLVWPSSSSQDAPRPMRYIDLQCA